MKNAILKTAVSMLLAVMLAGCIDEYDISELNIPPADEIFARGEIKVGAESYVSLQLATPFSDWTERYVDNAEVRVVGENGFQSEKGKFNEYTHLYEIDTYDATPNSRYRVEIKCGNDEFASNYMELLYTPEINKLYYEVNKTKGVVEVFADVDNIGSQQKYLWTYEENFEVIAPLKAESIVFDGGFIAEYSRLYYDFSYPQNHIYCWAKHNSTSINLYNTSNLTEASVKHHKVAEVPGDDIKFDGLYCITVFLNAISDEAYDYYEELKRQTESSGSIFTPMPSDVRGNITCISNDKKIMRGTITASLPTVKQLFIDRDEVKEIISQDFGLAYVKPDPQISWKDFINDIKQRITDGYIIWGTQPASSMYDLTPSGTRFYYPHMCNCIMRGGTPYKPSWWPN
ncbi:MAG: DUF4249 family protein [Muribaculaceae bacterium]